MSVHPVLRFPDPILKKTAEAVVNFDRALEAVIQDLIDTMYASPATIGLAAPQIGIAQQIFVCDLSKKNPSRKLMVFINPKIVKAAGKQLGREGCLSLPDYTGNVLRAETVTIHARDAEGKTFKITSSGFEAVCWQHEIDHLNGMLFIHRVTNVKTDVFRRKRYQS